MKYWKVLTAAAMLLGLTACGGGGGDDKNDPPPPKPGDAGSVVISAQKPAFVKVDAPAGAAAKSIELLVVDFTLKDAQGNPVALAATEELSFSVTKLIPGRVSYVDTTTDKNVIGPSVWKAFYYGSTPPTPGSATAKASFEKAKVSTLAPAKGVLNDLGNGNYRYYFQADFHGTPDPYVEDSADNIVNGTAMIAWDEDKLHRLAVTFGDELKLASTMPAVNYTLDWVPSGKTAALTRDILEQESCSDCHMDQVIHHTKPSKGVVNRKDPKICVACHNDSNPAAAVVEEGKTPRRSLAAVVHDFHSTGKGKPVVVIPDDPNTPDINESVIVTHGKDYPQDPRNCDTCHKPVTPTTPNAHDWTVPTQVTCKSCHADKETHYSNRDCRTCHADGNTEKPGLAVTNAHVDRLKGMQTGAATLGIDIWQALYDFDTKRVTVSLKITENGSTPMDMERLLRSAYKNPGLLVNWDEGEGKVLPNSHSTITLAKCDATAGDLTCVTEPITDVIPASDAVLTITVADMGLCVEKQATEVDGKPAGLVDCPEDGLITIAKDHFEYIAAPTIPVAHFDLSGNPAEGYKYAVGAEKALCENCHKNFELHFSGSIYDHVARDFNQCGNCHNAERAPDYAPYLGMAGDLKYHVHSYHNWGSHRGAAHVVDTNKDGSTDDEAQAIIPFPGKINNCESCHTKEQYNLPNKANARPSVAFKLITPDNPTTPDDETERDNMYYSPALVACGSCHLKSELGNVNLSAPVAGDEWASHMQEHGAKFGVATAAEATGTEDCHSCHSVGQDMGVDKVHNVFDFR